MVRLQRMTTEYLAIEDRIRITGEGKEKEVAVLWLTQRILLRLLPHVLEWLERQTLTDMGQVGSDPQTNDMLQTFAQQSAQAQLVNVAPVKPAKTDPEAEHSGGNNLQDDSLLAVSVDIKKNNQATQLVFKSPNGREVKIILTPQQMRQWLAIIREHWERASWPTSVWPQWFGAATQEKSDAISTDMH